MRLIKDWRKLKFVRQMGIEPLEQEFSVRKFKEMLAAKKTKIKPLLMDQTFIAGIGNLYAQEALFLAGILPGRPANKLKDKEDIFVFHAGTKLTERLVTSGGRVLGIVALGATIQEAQAKAYSAIESIHFDKMHYRKDIGSKALKFV